MNDESDIPFICFSGAVGEEKAVELHKHGDTDYIPKDTHGIVTQDNF